MSWPRDPHGMRHGRSRVDGFLQRALSRQVDLYHLPLVQVQEIVREIATVSRTSVYSIEDAEAIWLKLYKTSRADRERGADVFAAIASDRLKLEAEWTQYRKSPPWALLWIGLGLVGLTLWAWLWLVVGIEPFG